MAINIFSIDKDMVINSFYLTTKATYKYAIENVVPLMQKLEFQRKVQSPKFYERLSDDIVDGCIMPPLTLAFIESDTNKFKNKQNPFFENYIEKNIKNGFVLDGIQRLNTLKKSAQKKNFNENLPIFFNILICPSNDKLLYRMITLNNGQKPMTARHQVEVLLSNIYQFQGDSINILTEKEAVGGKARGSFKKSSFINAYLSFLSDSTNVDNKKIIEEKLDELLATRIIERGIAKGKIEYSDIISLVSEWSESNNIKKWFQNENNLIGFSVAMRDSYQHVANMTAEDFFARIEFFEELFSHTDVSKVRVSSYRRKMVCQYFKSLKKIDAEEMEPGEAFMFISDKVE